MQSIRRIMAWCAIAFGGFVILVFALPSYRQGEASIAGKTAYREAHWYAPDPKLDFALELEGKPEHLSDFRGKVVVLNFWATWCPPCVEEAPALNQLQKYIEPKGGTILGVSVDEDPTAYAKFLADHGVDFPTWRDPAVDGNTWPIANEYGTKMIPETYVINRDGTILRKIIGPQEWNSPEMLSYFDVILKQ
ncbi:MAG TPA: TlpA disulfide reductase family protein [Terriglobales bacterium]|nr:TlpA disulfide reductase family protein [Terriglobales bacterium]